MIRHIVQLSTPHELSATNLALVWLVSFGALTWTNLLAVLERPRKTTSAQNEKLDTLHVTVLVPAYNEDINLLKGCIQSMFDQTRKPNSVVVVDDGSTVDYSPVQTWLKSLPDRHSIDIQWVRTANGGKRHAQGVGIERTPEAHVYVTVDSDTVLDPKAIAEGLKPFIDSNVSAVAGVCLPINVSDNLLTRFTGLWETIWQLTERSAQSTLGCVTVNSGILAFYKAPVIRRYLSAYLNETFFGREVKYSDDSLMTLYSMMHGKTIQQPTSICFSAVPNKYSHHLRRYTRWMRGSFIRTWWRFKYLPMRRYIYWLHLFRWIQFGISTTVVTYLVVTGVLYKPELLPYLIVIPVAVGYLQSLRYLTIQRNDEGKLNRFVTFMTAPIAILWSLTALRVVKYYAIATCFNNKWGTRSKQELSVTV